MILSNQNVRKYLCVGLDSDYEKLPEVIRKGNSISQSIFLFNKEIIDATIDLIAAYKPNLVFYSAYGVEGWKALLKTNEYIKRRNSKIQLIAECKRTEIGRTAELSARELFDDYMFDAANIMPWYGSDSVKYFEKRPDKKLYVICHDTNPSAIELQNVKLKNGMYMYEHVAKLVTKKWNKSGNIFIETALTYPKELKRIKEISDKRQFFLIVGLGAQGGKIEDLKIFKKDKNFVVSASRSVIFVSSGKDFAEAARIVAENYCSQINKVLS